MGLTNENVGPKILAKIKIYVLTRAELLFKVCYEIPCTYLPKNLMSYMNAPLGFSNIQYESTASVRVFNFIHDKF